MNECDFVEKINITSSSILNYDGLKHLRNLKELILEEPKGKVNLEYHLKIKRLSIEYGKNIVGLEQLKCIEKLSIRKYNPKCRNLSELRELKSIQELELIGSTINSLKGCEYFLNIYRLKLCYLSKLSRIDELEKIKDSLKILEIESCKRIENPEYVNCLKNLEELSYNECGDIETVRFIEGLPKLKSFIFMGTNVLDGNLQACKRLKYVAFVDKKHYSHKNSDFKSD